MQTFSIIDSSLRSWLELPKQTDFPLQNLPFGVFSTSDASEARVGMALGDFVIDTVVLFDAGLLSGITGLNRGHLLSASLNSLMQAGAPVWRSLRCRVAELFTQGNSSIAENADLQTKALRKQSNVRMHMPVRVSNYVDFYSSLEHATNVGSMFRDPQNPLLPNWLHIPIGYNGRSSSVIPSGQSIVRPSGQLKNDTEPAPMFAPSKQLDFELEMAFITGQSTQLGHPIDISRTDAHIFGMTLLNDWSARDIQKWEYVPQVFLHGL
jgi:fumarylacetoacetase